MADFLSDLQRRLGQAGSALGGPFERAVDALSNRLAGPPRTITRTDHKALFYVRSGTRQGAIGGVYEFAHAQGQAATPIFVASRNPTGLPSDIVPGALTTRTINIGRFDLWTDILEQVLGTDDLSVLTEASGPLALREQWTGPALIPATGAIARWEYRGCRFVELRRTNNSTGDRVVRATGALVWQDRIRL